MKTKILIVVILILSILIIANYSKTIPNPTPQVETITSYANMNLLTKSNLTSDKLKNDILRISPNSPIAQYSNDFILAEKNHGINALFLASLSIREVGWSADTSYVKQYNNIFNYHLGLPDGQFKDWHDCIDRVGASIVVNYLTPNGLHYVSPTIKGMSVNYSTSSLWADGIVSIMQRLEPLN